MCVCFGRRDGWRWSFDLMTTGARKLDNSLLHLLPTTWFSPTTTTIVGTTPRPRSQHCVCVLLMYCRGFSWKFDGESAPLWWSLCICRSKVKVAETRDGEREREESRVGFWSFYRKERGRFTPDLVLALFALRCLLLLLLLPVYLAGWVALKLNYEVGIRDLAVCWMGRRRRRRERKREREKGLVH